jgi:hypothetical protein
MLQQKLRIKNTPVQLTKREDVLLDDAGDVDEKKTRYGVEMLRKLGREMVSGGQITAWPEDIASQYVDLSKSKPGPHLPVDSKRGMPTGVAVSAATPSRSSTAPSSSSASSSNEIPPFEYRIQVCAKRGFAILHRPPPSTDCLHAFQHRHPWKAFSEVKVVGSWTIKEIQHVTAAAAAGKKQEGGGGGVREWLLTSSSPGGTGMVKWLDGDDNVLCSLTLRVPQRQFVMNSCRDQTWGKE